MKIDFLNELVDLLGSTGVTPEQYMIEHSLFFDEDVVNNAFDEMLNNVKKNIPVPVRKSTKQGVVYQNGQQKLWKSIYQDVPDLEVTIDSDGNREVRALINRLTGITISQGVNSSIMFGKISHIWGEAINPLFFTALWNVVIVPAYVNDVLDKNDDTHPFVSKIKEIFKAICWTKYDVENKLAKLGLTDQEIGKYAPNVSVLTGFSYKLNTIPMVKKLKGKKSSIGGTVRSTKKGSTNVKKLFRDKNDLLNRLLAYINKAKAKPLKHGINPKQHKNWLSTQGYSSSAVTQYVDWIDTTKHPELKPLLKTYGIYKMTTNGGTITIIIEIYYCKDLVQITNVLKELVENRTQNAINANHHQNMVAAVCHFIEHLLDANGIKI